MASDSPVDREAESSQLCLLAALAILLSHQASVASTMRKGYVGILAIPRSF